MLREHFLTILENSTPIEQVGAIILGTFILEDATTALVALAVSEMLLTPATALIGLYLGVSLGDFGLYWSGRLAARYPWLHRLVRVDHRRFVSGLLGNNALLAVFSSRFVPGMRLPTYTAFGFFHIPFLRFALPVVLATLIWTSLLFGLCLLFGRYVFSELGEWRWCVAIAVAAALVVFVRWRYRRAMRSPP